ncbi:hypothetical protein BPODLACK_01124 [Gordonia sp. YY1]|uniref:Integral membrane protein n=1 Tax=Gordonia alkanivorans NBRC 16433 TaxID=1027371 RepID=F9VZG2_9ACTN|nr:hypothetical protein BPODLACK_01124 [Gordonia sp. YY1]GAA14001.1 hypothetical protein GOALK_097_00270 [Gordonia alkanivorans NBRC 16433]
MRGHRPTGAEYPGRVSTEKDRPEQDRLEIDVDPSVTPTQIKVAGAVTTVEGLVGVAVAVILVIRGLAGHEETAISGYGTAIWFGIIGGGVLVGGVALLAGRRWGRSIAMVAQILLLPVAYYLYTSGWPVFSVPLALAAIAGLVMLFSPAAVRWLAGDLEPDH